MSTSEFAWSAGFAPYAPFALYALYSGTGIAVGVSLAIILFDAGDRAARSWRRLADVVPEEHAPQCAEHAAPAVHECAEGCLDAEECDAAQQDAEEEKRAEHVPCVTRYKIRGRYFLGPCRVREETGETCRVCPPRDADSDTDSDTHSDTDSDGEWVPLSSLEAVKTRPRVRRARRRRATKH